MHWASTARTGKLLVKEFEQETQPVFNLLLNLAAPWKSKEQFELAVCTVSSLCHFGYQAGAVPQLLLSPPAYSRSVREFLYDLPEERSGWDATMEILARVEPITSAGKHSIVAESEDESNALAEKQVLAVLPSGEQQC